MRSRGNDRFCEGDVVYMAKESSGLLTNATFAFFMFLYKRKLCVDKTMFVDNMSNAVRYKAKSVCKQDLFMLILSRL